VRSDTLGRFEHEVLAAVMELAANAYGTTIRERLKERTEREPSVGALYTTLDRLEAKGFVSSWWGEPTPERGGRRKRFYKISAEGTNAVRRTESRIQKWPAFGGFVPVGG